jgi:hypothetical protein
LLTTLCNIRVGTTNLKTGRGVERLPFFLACTIYK